MQPLWKTDRLIKVYVLELEILLLDAGPNVYKNICATYVIVTQNWKKSQYLFTQQINIAGSYRIISRQYTDD